MSFAFALYPPDMYNAVYNIESQNHSFARMQTEEVLRKWMFDSRIDNDTIFTLQYFDPGTPPASR